MSVAERGAGESSPWEPPDRRDEPPGGDAGEQTVEATGPPSTAPLSPAPTTPVRRVQTRAPGAAREILRPVRGPGGRARPGPQRVPATWAARGSFRVADEDARLHRQMSR
ncbi:MAG: hypothetical protein OXG38_00645, partial [Chloroflexi bacterium]|nr:hypothetical protein [Chloroflexota bacterium]